jgi:hypothetical protein
MAPPARPSQAVALIGSFALTALAGIVWPAAWVASVWLHVQDCGGGIEAWTCDEPLTMAVLHQLLLLAGPWLSLVLANVSFELRASLALGRRE